MSSVINTSDANFDADVLKNEKPVIVDFWAEWCGPCRKIAPILEEIAAEHPNVQVVKVNVDDNQAIAAQFGITSIPAVYAFKNGEIVARSIGAKPKQALLEDFSEIFS